MCEIIDKNIEKKRSLYAGMLFIKPSVMLYQLRFNFRAHNDDDDDDGELHRKLMLI